MTVYDTTVTTLTPMHIGDGGELRQDFDYVVNQGYTYRLDEDEILRAREAVLNQIHNNQYPLPGRLIQGADYVNNSLFRYKLRGQPRSKRTDARIQTFIKDVHDRPYLPGSSIKGAIRTALAWTGWDETNLQFRSTHDLGHSKSWAGQSFEKQLFGKNPNFDLLRALHVSDHFGPSEPGGDLLLVNAQVLSKRSAGSPIELEALRGDVALQGTITIDETLFSGMAEQKLHFSNRKHWLDELMPRAQAHSRARIEKMISWFEDADHAKRVKAFYQQLYNLNLPNNQAFMQIGWGSGWDGKTFWTHLQKDAGLFERVISQYQLARQPRGAPARNVGDPFPKSKRAVMQMKGGNALAIAPFGWALVEMKERDK